MHDRVCGDTLRTPDSWKRMAPPTPEEAERSRIPDVDEAISEAEEFLAELDD